jgi:hypothetical protein
MKALLNYYSVRGASLSSYVAVKSINLGAIGINSDVHQLALMGVWWQHPLEIHN